MLREAVDLLQPLLAGGTVLEGDLRWICASLVPLGGFRSMGHIEQPVFACRLDMQQHMQQLQLLGAVDTLIGDPKGWPQGLFSSGMLAVLPGRRGRNFARAD